MSLSEKNTFGVNNMSDNADTDDVVLEPGDSASEEEKEEGSLVVKNRKVQFRFDAVSDELLCKEVLAQNPYEADFGDVGSTWDRVASALAVGIYGRR